jgi:hypothetical protein
VGRLADQIGAAVPDVPRTFESVHCGTVLVKGPFRVPTRWWIESMAGSLAFTVDAGHPGFFVP